MSDKHPSYFRTQEEIDLYFSEEKLTCLLCGKKFHALGNHLRFAHNMTAEDYKEQFGLPWRRGLITTRIKSILTESVTRTRALGMLPDISSPEYRTKVLEGTRKPRRRMPEAMIRKNTQNLPKGEDHWRIWDESHVLEFIRRVGTGRTLTEVGGDPDLPTRYFIDVYLREHPAMYKHFDEVWNNVPFHVQIKGQRTGERFKVTVVKLREEMKLTWPQIGRAMGIKEGTARTTYHALKHKGSLDYYRSLFVRYPDHIPPSF